MCVYMCVCMCLTFEFSIKGPESSSDNLLNSPALSPGAVGRKTVPPDAATSAHTGRQDIV